MKNVSESLAGRIGILHLTGISLRERLSDDFLEPFIPSKEYILNRKPNTMIHSPEKLWHEIDLLIEDSGTLYPVEVKKTASPVKKDIASFAMMSRIQNIKIGTGCVVCPCSATGIIAPDVFCVPVENI